MNLEAKLNKYTEQLSNFVSDFSKLTINYIGKCVLFSINEDEISSLKNQLGHLTCNDLATESISFIKYGKSVKFNFSLETSIYKSENFNLWYLPFLDSVLLEDKSKKQSFVIYRSEIPPLSSDYLRIIFQFLLKTNAVPVHGGSIAWDSNSALISNVGGSGKSTLIGCSVLLGASTTGDDFGMVEFKNSTATVWSQFGTLKLSRQFAAKNLTSAVPISKAETKDIYSFSDFKSGSVVPQQKVDLILIPKLGNKFEIRECSWQFAFERIAPSSAGMAINRQATNLMLKTILQSLPSYELVLGPDIVENSKLLQKTLQL